MSPEPIRSLIDAIQRNDAAAFRQSLDDPTQIAAVDRDGRAALHYAVIDTRIEFITALLGRGADASVADRSGWTPLHFAARDQSLPVVELLLQAGAAVDARDAHGNTPLFKAVFASRGRGAVIECLLRAGADRHLVNGHGVSPYRLARTIANYNVRQFL